MPSLLFAHRERHADCVKRIITDRVEFRFLNEASNRDGYEILPVQIRDLLAIIVYYRGENDAFDAARSQDVGMSRRGNMRVPLIVFAIVANSVGEFDGELLEALQVSTYVRTGYDCNSLVAVVIDELVSMLHEGRYHGIWPVVERGRNFLNLFAGLSAYLWRV